MSEIVVFDKPEDAFDAVHSANVRRAIGTSLAKHYPRRRWLVDVNIKGGVAKVYLPAVSLRNAYVIHVHQRTMKELEQKAIIAGGEILERFKLSRGQQASTNDELSINRLANGEAINAATGS